MHTLQRKKLISRAGFLNICTCEGTPNNFSQNITIACTASSCSVKEKTKLQLHDIISPKRFDLIVCCPLHNTHLILLLCKELMLTGYRWGCYIPVVGTVQGLGNARVALCISRHCACAEAKSPSRLLNTPPPLSPNQTVIQYYVYIA